MGVIGIEEDWLAGLLAQSSDHGGNFANEIALALGSSNPGTFNARAAAATAFNATRSDTLWPIATRPRWASPNASPSANIPGPPRRFRVQRMGVSLVDQSRPITI
jgi:hypothetical protein